MAPKSSYFRNIEDPYSVITPITSGMTFPEFLEEKLNKYTPFIKEFAELIDSSKSSAELLEKIRDSQTKMHTEKRVSFLKLFRRCVSPVCDTEATKKITKIPTTVFIENYGHTFKTISKLKQQFSKFSEGEISALSVLLGEYDNRGEEGYVLTELFFTWFEESFDNMSIQGPRGAGQDIQLSSLFNEYEGSFPCDFVVRNKSSEKVLAVGFARYDSTRGGAQSDDRTGGNSDKVYKIQNFSNKQGISLKVIFLSDGPGLTHKDTWQEACELDGERNGNVRVTTLKTSPDIITSEWLHSD